MSDNSASSQQSAMEIAVTAPIITVTAEDVMRRMSGGERFNFVDARTVDEWIRSPGRIERSVRMTVSEVGERLRALLRDRAVVTYCMWPDEDASNLVALELTRLGVADVHPLAGGLAAWRAAGGSIER
jgi:rhodanese-related sulfurtransferase